MSGVHNSVSEADPRVTEFYGSADVQSWAEPRTAWYFMLTPMESHISEFCVINWTGPQRVSTPAPDGTVQYWKSRERNGILIFTPPDGYDSGPIGWMYDPRLQRKAPLPPEEMERLCGGSKHSVNF